MLALLEQEMTVGPTTSICRGPYKGVLSIFMQASGELFLSLLQARWRKAGHLFWLHNTTAACQGLSAEDAQATVGLLIPCHVPIPLGEVEHLTLIELFGTIPTRINTF